MKRRIFSFVCLTSLLLCFTACGTDVTIPSKIQVKASPTYKIPAGTITANLKDFLNAESINAMFGDDSKVTVYDYKTSESDETLRYLLQMDFDYTIAGLDIDSTFTEALGSYTDPVYFGYEDNNNPTTPKVMFTVPELSQQVDLGTTTFDFKSLGVSDNLNTDTTPITILGSADGSETTIPIPLGLTLCKNDATTTFDSLTFASGSKIKINFTKCTEGVATKATINSVAIYDSYDQTTSTYGNCLASTTSTADLVSGDASVEIDVSGKTIPNATYIKFSFTVAGTTLTSTDKSTFAIDYSGIDVAKINGFKTTENLSVDLPSNITVDLGTSVFKSATIAAADNTADLATPSGGEISFTFSGIDSNVMSIEPTLTLKQEADGTYTGLNISEKTLTNGALDLGGASINSNKIDVSGKIGITPANTTGVDISLPINVGIKADLDISKLASVVISSDTIPTDDFKYSLTQDISGVTDYVTKIQFDNLGIKTKFCNGLPIDVTLHAKSTFLFNNTDTHSATYSKNATALPDSYNTSFVITTYNTDSSAFDFTRSNIQKADAENTQVMDFDLTVDLGASDGVITLTDIVPGTDYYFYGEAQLVMDWTSVYFTIPDNYTGFSGSIPDTDNGGTPINLSTIGKIMGDYLEFKDINVYGYVESDLLKTGGALSAIDVTFKAGMNAQYTDPSDGTTPKTVYFFGSADTPEQKLEFVTRPELTKNSDGIIVQKLNASSASFYTSEFTNILNDSPSDLTFAYSLKLEGETEGSKPSGWITKESLKSVTGEGTQDSTIYFRMLVDFPVQLNILPNELGYVPIDVLKLMSNSTDSSDSESTESTEETDLLGRSSSTDTTTLSTVFDYVEKATITVDYENDTGLDLSFILADGENDEFKFTGTLKQGTGQLTLNLDYDKAEYVMKTYPFYPDKFEVHVPCSTEKETIMAIKRDGDLKVRVFAQVDANIDYTYDFSGGAQ